MHATNNDRAISQYILCGSEVTWTIKQLDVKRGTFRCPSAP